MAWKEVDDGKYRQRIEKLKDGLLSPMTETEQKEYGFVDELVVELDSEEEREVEWDVEPMEEVVAQLEVSKPKSANESLSDDRGGSRGNNYGGSRGNNYGGSRCNNYGGSRIGGKKSVAIRSVVNVVGSATLNRSMGQRHHPTMMKYRNNNNNKNNNNNNIRKHSPEWIAGKKRRKARRRERQRIRVQDECDRMATGELTKNDVHLAQLQRFQVANEMKLRQALKIDLKLQLSRRVNEWRTKEALRTAKSAKEAARLAKDARRIESIMLPELDDSLAAIDLDETLPAILMDE